MPRIALSWDAVAGASGYNIHAGPVSGLYTEVADVGNVTSGSITVPTNGTWYLAVAAYDGDGYEGPYSDPVMKATYTSQIALVLQ